MSASPPATQTLRVQGGWIYVNCVSSSARAGRLLNGGYFPPLILEDLRRIVSSRTESFSSAVTGTGVVDTTGFTDVDCDCRRLSASALVMRASQAERHRVRVEGGRFVEDARVR